MLLPHAMRPHVAAVYAFARRADDMADEEECAGHLTIAAETVEHVTHVRRHVARHVENPPQHLALNRADDEVDRDRNYGVNDRAKDPREQTHQRAITRRDRLRVALLKDVGSNESAADNPETAAQIAGRHDGQRGQQSHDGAADQCRANVVRASRSTHGPDA